MQRETRRYACDGAKMPGRVAEGGGAVGEEGVHYADARQESMAAWQSHCPAASATQDRCNRQQ